MEYSNIRYEARDGVAVITYDRQERRNAWDVPTYREIVEAVERANADEAVGALVLTHEGPVYCAGVDVKAPPEPKDPVTGRRPSTATLGMADDTSWIHLLQRSKPSIVAVNGLAMGLGATHTLAADIRVASTAATFSFPFLKFSTMPEFGCSALLPRIVGFGRAMDICLTAASLDAPEAERIGLISRVFPEEGFLDHVLALAGQIAGYARQQVALTRGMFHGNMLETDLNAILTREREAFITLLKSRGSTAPTSVRPQP